MDRDEPRIHRCPPLEEIVAIACRAPSLHNSQPWLWRIVGDRLELLADWSRHLPHADPDGRDLVISCGAALHHVRVAAAGLGWTTDVRYRSSTGWDPDLATVSFDRVAPGPDAARRLAALLDRQTDRRPLVADASAHLAGHLAQQGRRWGVDVLVAEQRLRTRALELSHEADALQRADAGYVRELVTWTRSGLRDGVPAANLPRLHDEVPGDPGTAPRRFPPGHLPAPQVATSPPGRLLVFASGSDTIEAWLRTGEALSDLWIEATQLGLTLVPLSQVAEVGSSRDPLEQELPGGPSHLHIAARVGWLPLGTAPLPRSPRRSMDDVLVRAAAS